MEGKTQQLDAADAPTASFRWVQSTPIPKWFATGSDIFWISGKPGSGKSVLVRHLASSQSTLDQLRSWRKECQIIEFYFDFRAGHRTANKISGMLKSLIQQVCSQNLSAVRQLHELVEKATLKAADEAKLEVTLVKLVQHLNLPICAFVDGLDEYAEDWVALVETLERLRNRTGMKLCVASRPETQFKQMFQEYPSIRLQEHNVASLRLYMDRALLKAIKHNPDIKIMIKDDLKDEIVWKSQGVILWARLAIDQLIQGCNAGLSYKMLRKSLSTLPVEVSSMYERMFLATPIKLATEKAICLFIIVHWNETLSVDQLHGLWDLLVKRFHVVDSGLLHQTLKDFNQRLDIMLGTLIDIHSDQTIKLLHRTLHDYVKKSQWMQSNLPQPFQARFPDNIGVRLRAYTIICAGEEGLLIETNSTLTCPSSCTSPKDHQNQYDVFCLLPDEVINEKIATLRRRDRIRGLLDFIILKFQYGRWVVRRSVLTNSIVSLPNLLDSVRGSDWSELVGEVSLALSFPLMFQVCRHLQMFGKEMQTFHHTKPHTGQIDLVIAIDYRAPKFAVARLHSAPITPIEAQEIFDLLVERRLSSNTRSREALPEGNCEWSNLLVEALLNAGALVGYHHVCLTMMHDWTDDRLRTNGQFLLRLLRKHPVTTGTMYHHPLCQNHGTRNNFFFEWLDRSLAIQQRLLSCFAPEDVRRLTYGYLSLVIALGEDINAISYPRGTVLHAAVDSRIHSEVHVNFRLNVLSLLILVGADPAVEFHGRSPQDYAQRLLRTLPMRSCRSHATSEVVQIQITGRGRQGLLLLLDRTEMGNRLRQMYRQSEVIFTFVLAEAEPQPIDHDSEINTSYMPTLIPVRLE